MSFAGRSMRTLRGRMDAEYRFYANSLRNMITTFQHTAPAGNQDLGNNNLTLGIDDDLLGYADQTMNHPNPHQGVALGMPCLVVDAYNQQFGVTSSLQFGATSSFSLEYVGVPRSNWGFGPNNPCRGQITLLSDPVQGSTYNRYIQLYSDDDLNGDTSLDIDWDGLGAPNLSSVVPAIWWRPGNPLHLIITRSVVEDPEIPGNYTSTWTAYFNGRAVIWYNDENTQTSAYGLSSDGVLFNNIYTENQQVYYEPFTGSHFLLRKYTVVVADDEVQRLFADAQKTFENLLWPVPWRDREPQ